MKKSLGPILAVLVVGIVGSIGFVLGKNISYAYNEEKITQNILEVLKIENQSIPIKYILKDGAKSLEELCGKDTGVCDTNVGTITLKQIDLKLDIYTNFDNPDAQANTYFKLDNRKIGNFVYLDKFAIFNENYLLVTELNSENDNYIIHLYDHKGIEVASFEGTKLQNKNYEIKNDALYFYYCNPADTLVENDEIYNNVIYYKVGVDSLTKSLISKEYQKCV